MLLHDGKRYTQDKLIEYLMEYEDISEKEAVFQLWFMSIDGMHYMIDYIEKKRGIR